MLQFIKAGLTAVTGGYIMTPKKITKTEHEIRGKNAPKTRLNWTIIVVWLSMICCDPYWKPYSFGVNGLPIGRRTNNGIDLRSTNSFSVILTRHHYHDDDKENFPKPDFIDFLEKDKVEMNPKDEGHDKAIAVSTPQITPRLKRSNELQESSSLDMNRMSRERRKKGLSYLTKFYSQAVLNNSSSQNFFGITSAELRFPSVQRKLSFYQPMTPPNNSVMSPWSRIHSNTRSTPMRLRWGK